MTQPDLDQLVALARRERAAPGALAAVARNLRVPFAMAPIAAMVVPSSALGGMAAKLGLTRLALLGWGTGSALAVTGAIAVVALHEPSAVPAVPRVPVAHVVGEQAAPRTAPQAAAPVPEPEAAVVAPSAERRAASAKDAPATWDEPQLIERARRALANDPRRALSLAQEHQRRFPTGALSVERDVIVLEALARSGQTAEARRRALSFEAKYPKSIHLPRVHALLARLGSE